MERRERRTGGRRERRKKRGEERGAKEAGYEVDMRTEK